jgi:plastocyanin domain-containing protein
MKLKGLIYVIPLVLVLIAGFVVISRNSDTALAKAKTEGGFQVVEVSAKNGYSPRITEEKANTPTILRVTTKNTLDCSASLFIPDLKYQEFLPTNGETDIQILPQKSGTSITGSCSMGMYGFEIRFV